MAIFHGLDMVINHKFVSLKSAEVVTLFHKQRMPLINFFLVIYRIVMMQLTCV